MSHPEKPRTEAPTRPATADAPGDGPPLVVPRQRRRDAYTLYAEIYALQRELNRADGSPAG